MRVQAQTRTNGRYAGYDDAISWLKDCAWEGFKLNQAGTLEDFEMLWGEAFEILLCDSDTAEWQE